MAVNYDHLLRTQLGPCSEMALKEEPRFVWVFGELALNKSLAFFVRLCTHISDPSAASRTSPKLSLDVPHPLQSCPSVHNQMDLSFAAMHLVAMEYRLAIQRLQALNPQIWVSASGAVNLPPIHGEKSRTTKASSTFNIKHHMNETRTLLVQRCDWIKIPTTIATMTVRMVQEVFFVQ